MNPVTASEARHAEDYSGLCDYLKAISEAEYEGKHAFRGRHADGPWDFAAEEAGWAVRCIYADPLWPQARHRTPGITS